MATTVDLMITLPAVAGLLWSVKEILYLKSVKLDGHQGEDSSDT